LTVWPAITSAPVRLNVIEFASTVKRTVPLLVLFVVEPMEIQLLVVETVQVHPRLVVTLMLPFVRA
jgi:hypothetical protein